ncbi:hypothetical protein DIU31_031940 [Mucilaginibacter rubeus]|uniref:Uncharacterized protein n=2 Tax=Mucilaginibacter TaxID=423349 RepID=A0AAE6MLI0_9SPHI|nr:hypothetical protein [Mucilaginibacter rubeus]QEM07893.1 hypothetical protein DIU31_031940 [Mucilaginibacter rubeus]QTE42935.1 hypothetical protein J3L19_29110 [Mucilaginibacter rubeus]QTE49536.1 hypothetical protein J3L21_29070 [Mucilaginibacter rubeus]QTE54632.1 hypothetical protein J3L23_20695 [Mucilaginibacter rubeus]QTE65914.1 hypothetical protein J3L22_13135 [Mucilaginibacter rubeus]
MVKIKEGYVMSPRERAEFERQDALPRKKLGLVAYYFKPQTKYPPRIYAFIHAETWCDRNRRPMGLHTAIPFLTRPMSTAEIEYHHFDWRLCYHQYEDWDKLMRASAQEAEELDTDEDGTGTDFLNQLSAFGSKFPLKADLGGCPPDPPELPADEETLYLRELIATGDALNAAEVAKMFGDELQAQKRPAVLIALRQLYQNFEKPEEKRNALTEERIKRKVALQQQRKRRNLARRVWQKNKLFALQEIRVKYPDYTEEMLLADLHIKKKKEKRKKHKPVTDLRGCQLQKLAHRLKYVPLDEKEYHNTCNRIAILQQAHSLRLPVPLVVNLEKETLVYSFPWRIREGVVKDFVALANKAGMTHQALQERHKEMVSSNYSY